MGPRGGRRRIPALALVSALALGLAPRAFGDGGDAGLAARLAAALRVPALRGARVGALVVAAGDGQVVFARHADRALVPASNEKLLTALAALSAFGPTYRFTTDIQANAKPDASGAVDTLYVRGGGDPTLTSEQWWRLAADLRRGGLTRVRKAVVIDDSAFDALRRRSDWGPATDRAYDARIGALTANYGSFAVEVRPGAHPGAPVQATIDPPLDYFRLDVIARTGAPGSRDSLIVSRSREETQERVDVAGIVPADALAHVVYRSVADPGLYAGALLVAQLRANGIAVDGPVRRGKAPEDAPELLAFEGHELATIVRLMLKYSSNPIAETLVKALAVHAGVVPGTWPAGMRVVHEQLRSLGLDLSGARLVDGSGLSRHDRVPPRLLVAALRRARRSFAFGPELISALPIAAADGTLADRASTSAGEVRAKTGHLDHVTALSGFARLASGQEVVFSVLVNGYRGSDDGAMDALDGFAARLAHADRLPAPFVAQESPGPTAARRRE